MKYVLISFVLIAACVSEPKTEPVAVVDSSAWIASERARKTQDTLKMHVERIRIIMHVRDLHDSAENIYYEYTQGRDTYRNYLKARKAYIHEYDSVYVPMCNILGLKPEGGNN